MYVDIRFYAFFSLELTFQYIPIFSQCIAGLLGRGFSFFSKKFELFSLFDKVRERCNNEEGSNLVEKRGGRCCIELTLN